MTDISILSQSFYSQDCLTVASELLGCEIVHIDSDGQTTGGIIVETEAYSQDDSASHSFRGQTARNAVMFGPAGYAYVYLSYGIHYCINVVTGPVGHAEAVLIRAIEPTQGLDIMKGRRRTINLHNLASGPGKLVQALNVDISQNGASLTSGELFIRPRSKTPNIATSPRVGISSAVDKHWRFFVADSPFVTKHKFNREAVPLKS